MKYKPYELIHDVLLTMTKSGISRSQLTVLLSIYRVPGITAQELSVMTTLSDAHVSHISIYLEKTGDIKRTKGSLIASPRLLIYRHYITHQGVRLVHGVLSKLSINPHATISISTK